MARVARRVLLVALFALSAAPLPAQGNITYVYDDLGRLVAVIDPSGDTARYYYDAVGNLLSISRAPSSQVSILYFSPGKGPVGTQVTIYGTSFSSTPSQNTVTFNGTAATVVSSTVTQIVATVPSGATTGSINVTAPAGSTASAMPFTVTADAGEPTITSFTPAIGAPGEPVNITGTNFDLAPANNKIKFNLVATPTVVDAATTTNLTATVPSGGTSGRLTLTTPGGTTTSTADFFVPPSPYTAADVVLTTRMSVGSTTPVTIGTAGKIALIVFEGTVGQRLSLHANNSSINSAVITVYTSGGGFIGSTSSFTSAGYFIEPQALPVSGTYTIMVDPNGTVTGSLTLGISDVVDWSGYTSRSGPPVAMPLSTPGQNGNLLWSGNSGEQFSLKVTGIAIGGSTGLTILNPDGSTMVPLTYMSSGGTTFVDQKTTATTGNYTISVNPSVGNTGDATFTLYDATDFVGTITPGGPSQTVTISVPGQNAKLTFDGTAGQRVSLTIDNITIPNYTGSATIYLLKPDGSTLSSLFVYSPWTWLLEPQTLPVSGTYTVFVDAVWMNTGNATLTLYDVPPDPAGTITLDGSPVTLNLNSPGQNGSLTFAGTAGQNVSLWVTSSTIASGFVRLKKPDGTNLVSTGVGSGAFVEPQTLPTTGTYTLFVDPTGLSTGSITLRLYDVSHISSTITPSGPAVTVAITTPGQNATLTFAANAGQQVSLGVTSVTIPSSTVQIRKPDGTNVVLLSVGTSGAFFDKQTLPVTGTYSIFVNPAYQYTGSMTLTLYDATDITGTITPGGPAVTPTITSPGQNAQYTWSGTAGQLISLRATNNTMSTFVSVKKPDGTTLLSAGVTSGNALYFDRTSLPSTGTYTVLVDPSSTMTGSMTLTLYDVVDVTGPITPGGASVNAVLTTPGQNAEYTFAGNAGQNISLSMSGITISLSVVAIKKPDGTTLTQTGGISTSSAFIDRTSLPISGTYTIQINPSTYYVGNMTLTLHDLVDVGASLAINDPAAPVSITLPGQLANLTFSGTASQQVTVRITGNTTGVITVKLLKPDGTQLTSATASSSNFNLAQQTLPTTGTYSVVVDPATTNTGSVNVQVTSP